MCFTQFDFGHGFNGFIISKKYVHSSLLNKFYGMKKKIYYQSI